MSNRKNKDGKARFLCIDGPWSGKTLWLDAGQPDTLWFILGGQRMRYVAAGAGKVRCRYGL